MEVTRTDTSYAAATELKPVKNNGADNSVNNAPRNQSSASAVDEPSESIGTVEQKRGLNDAVEELQSAVESFDRKMNFSVDEKSGRFFVKVIDTSTDEVIREIPPEKVLKIVAHFKELLGLLFDETV